MIARLAAGCCHVEDAPGIRLDSALIAGATALRRRRREKKKGEDNEWDGKQKQKQKAAGAVMLSYRLIKPLTIGYTRFMPVRSPGVLSCVFVFLLHGVHFCFRRFRTLSVISCHTPRVS